MKRALLLLLALSTSALAQTPPPPVPTDRFVINNLSVFRLNPLGLENQTRAGYQRKLYASDALISRDNFLFLGLYPKVSPVQVRGGPTVEIQPLSMFNLRLMAEGVAFYGTQGFVQSAPTAQTDYSDTTLELGKESGANYAATGTHFSVEPLVQLRVGPIAVRNRFSFEYWKLGVREGDTVFYDATLDTLVPADGFNIADDLDVLYMGLPPLVVGLRYSMVAPLYTADEKGPVGVEVDNSHHRVGLLAAYVFFDEGYTGFNKPAVLVNISWYLKHRFRTGADVSRAVPYVMVGFAFQSDLLGGS